MKMRSRRWRRRVPSLLLLLLALAYACAALVCVCALHEAPFVLTSDSKYASSLTVDALALDDDAEDDNDPVAFTLEAAQEEAARLLGSFGEGVFLSDDDEDDGDEGGSETIAGFDGGVENASVEKEDRDDAEREVANDANVRRVTIKLHRSDATVENSDGDAESGADEDFGVPRSDDKTSVDANGDDDTESEADAGVESEAENDSDDGFFDDETDAQTEADLEETEAESEEFAELIHRPSAAEDREEEEGSNDAELQQSVEETSDDGSAKEQEPSPISKRVGAVLLKVRGVIFPHSRADDWSNAGDAVPDTSLDETSSGDTPAGAAPAIPPSGGEVMLDVHGEQDGAPSSSYKDTVAVVEQPSSFPSAALSRDPIDLEADDPSDLADTEESDSEGDVSSSSHTEAAQEAIETMSLESADFLFDQADNEQSNDPSDSIAAGESGIERDDIEVVEVVFKPEAEEESPFFSSLNEGLLVEFSITDDADADAAAFDEKEIEEVVAAVVVDALCEADPASDTNTCEPHLPATPILASEQCSSTEHDVPTVTFQEIVLEMATAAEQIVDALRQGHYPRIPVALSRARAKSRAKFDACVKAVKDPVGDVIHTLHAYFSVAKAEIASGLETALVHLSTLYEYMERYASLWSHYVCSAYRQVSQWSWEVWSTYEEVRILGRNVFGLVLLLPCGLLFSSLYRAVAAVPEFLCTYFLTFDEVTRAQLKIFSVVLLMVLVYHARVLAWFWILLSAALGYYYWSGHVVISVKFK